MSRSVQRYLNTHLVDERYTAGSTAAEEDCSDGNSLRILPGGVQAGAVHQRRAESGIGMSGRGGDLAGLPGLAAPVSAGPGLVPHTLPPAISFIDEVRNCPHHTPPSSVMATLLKIVSLNMVAMATGLLARLVPGATPKNPFSGLIALSWPEVSGRSQAMSSPTTVTS